MSQSQIIARRIDPAANQKDTSHEQHHITKQVPNAKHAPRIGGDLNGTGNATAPRAAEGSPL
jgi:hypothetical protein